MEGPRPATPEEFDKVMELVNFVFLPDAAPTMQYDYPLVFNRENTENLRIIVEDGKPVSHISLKQWPICVCGCITKIGSIGSVCTYPEYRGKGFATKILEHCVNDLDMFGGSLMLISGSRGLYRRAHATSVGKMFSFTVTREEAEKVKDKGFEMAPFDPDRLPEYARLYQLEAVRFVRDPDQWKKMCHVAMKTEGRATRAIYEIRQGGELVAYAVLMLPTRSYHKGMAHLIEYAGSREAVMCCLSDMLAENKMDRAVLRVPAYDAPMKVQAMKLGVEPSVSTMPGTWKIINFPRFMGTLWRYLEERLGEATAAELYFADEDGEQMIRFREERFVARDPTHLMEILFGTAAGADSLDGVPDDIRGILEPIIPIPLPLAGMNSV